MITALPEPLTVAMDLAARVWNLMTEARLGQYERRFVVEAIGPRTRGHWVYAVEVTPASLDVVKAALEFLPPAGSRRDAVSYVLSALVNLTTTLENEARNGQEINLEA
jgi:hypothetical protein